MESLIVMGRYYTTFTVLFDDYRMMGFNIHKHSFVCVTSRAARAGYAVFSYYLSNQSNEK